MDCGNQNGADFLVSNEWRTKREGWQWASITRDRIVRCAVCVMSDLRWALIEALLCLWENQLITLGRMGVGWVGRVMEGCYDVIYV